MSINTAISRFRRRQASLFHTESKVERPGEGDPEFNETTGEEVLPERSLIYEGPCLFRPGIRSGGITGRDVTTGEREVRFVDATAKYPVDTPIQKDDLVTLTASQHDADLVGREFRVTDVARDEWQISRVVILEETTGVPAEEES